MKQTTSTDHRIAEDPQREKRFRCGYREGYIAAANQMRQLIDERQLSADEAAIILTNHHDGPLQEWFEADRNLRLDPPEPEFA